MSRDNLESKPLFPDLSVQAVKEFLASDLRLEVLGQTMLRYESWTFDYESISEPLSSQREMMIEEAGQAVSAYLSQLRPSEELVEFFLALTTRWRLYLLTVLDDWNPGLISDLALFAHERCDDSVPCAHFVHWLGIIDAAQELMFEA